LTINKHDFLDLKQAGLASEKRLSGFYFCPHDLKTSFVCMLYNNIVVFFLDRLVKVKGARYRVKGERKKSKPGAVG